MVPASRTTVGPPVSRSSSVDDDLSRLEIEGYRIEFSTRVALLPVDLAEDGPRQGAS
jgi:hypothetical protein